MISLQAELAESINNQIIKLNEASGVEECKWYKLSSAKDRFAIQKVIELCLEIIDPESFRIDVLVWDIEDNRHRIIGRDDVKNLKNMYIQLLKNVIFKRWKGDTAWEVYPDQNNSIDWIHVLNILKKLPEYNDDSALFLDKQMKQFSCVHKVKVVEEVDSKLFGLCQAIDIFTGMCVFSHEKIEVFNEWMRRKSEQLTLFDMNTDLKLSKKDKEQSTVLDHFISLSKTKSIKFQLTDNQGLRSMDPSQPVNFWLYDPKKSYDKAPIKPKKSSLRDQDIFIR